MFYFILFFYLFSMVVAGGERRDQSVLSVLGRGLGRRRVEELKLTMGRNEECEDRLRGERSNG